MLGRLLRDVLGSRTPGHAGPDQPVTREAPVPEPAAIVRMRRDAAAHSRAPLAEHLQLLFSDARVGGRPLLDIVAESALQTRTIIGELKAFRRHYSMQALIQYFLRAGRLPGRRVECGVFTGLSSRVLCEAARAMDPAFDGSGYHMVDSFEGISAAQPEDFQSVRAEDGTEMLFPPAMGGPERFRAEADGVRRAFSDYPGARFHEGWIPDVLATLPEDGWSFVHIDVDMYAPTLACLEYFVPRLTPGGVVICDDYGAPTFPGAARAWLEFCDARDLPFVVLPTGQSILMNQP